MGKGGFRPRSIIQSPMTDRVVGHRARFATIQVLNRLLQASGRTLQQQSGREFWAGP